MDELEQVQQDAFVAAVEAIAPADGLRPTWIDGLWAFRSEETSTPSLVEYKLSLCVAAQGKKRVHFGDEAVVYDPVSCLLVALPLPLHAQVIEASPERPFLAVVVDIDVAVLSEIVAEVPELRVVDTSQRAVRKLPVTGDLLDAVLRLVCAARDEEDARVLGASLRREVMYRLLRTRQGGLLRTLAGQASGSRRIDRAVRFLRQNVEKKLRIQDIADAANMSESSLHHVFKEVTSMSPMQYLKRLRLHRAHELMVGEGLNAGEAAYAVGYSSPSQFSREFKSMLGTPPGRLRRSAITSPDRGEHRAG